MEMTDPTPRRSIFAVWHWPRWAWVIVVPLLLIVYPLSMGPASRLYYSDSISREGRDVLLIVYKPLRIACGESEFIARAMDWYTRLWFEDRS